MWILYVSSLNRRILPVCCNERVNPASFFRMCRRWILPLLHWRLFMPSSSLNGWLLYEWKNPPFLFNDLTVLYVNSASCRQWIRESCCFFFEIPENPAFFFQEWPNLAFFFLWTDESCFLSMSCLFIINVWVNLHFFVSDTMYLAYPSLNSCLFFVNE